MVQNTTIQVNQEEGFQLVSNAIRCPKEDVVKTVVRNSFNALADLNEEILEGMRDTQVMGDVGERNLSILNG